MIVNSYKYQNNKAFDLPKEVQDAILYTANDLRRLHGTLLGSPLWAFLEGLEKCGIYVEFGWPGHRGQHFFPTYEDAEGYNDWLFQCAEYDYDC